MTSDNSVLRNRYVLINDSLAGITLTFEPSSDLTLGSPRRVKDALSRVMSRIRRAKPLEMAIVEAQVRATFAPAARGRLRGVLGAVSADLDAFRVERLHPRVVEEILGISARERTRWTKDGRLPRSGAGSFRSGPQIVHFPLYRVQKIAALAADCEVIRGWREADAVASLHNPQAAITEGTTATENAPTSC